MGKIWMLRASTCYNNAAQRARVNVASRMATDDDPLTTIRRQYQLGAIDCMTESCCKAELSVNVVRSKIGEPSRPRVAEERCFDTIDMRLRQQAVGLHLDGGCPQRMLVNIEITHEDDAGEPDII